MCFQWHVFAFNGGVEEELNLLRALSLANSDAPSVILFLPQLMTSARHPTSAVSEARQIKLIATTIVTSNGVIVETWMDKDN